MHTPYSCTNECNCHLGIWSSSFICKEQPCHKVIKQIWHSNRELLSIINNFLLTRVLCFASSFRSNGASTIISFKCLKHTEYHFPSKIEINCQTQVVMNHPKWFFKFLLLTKFLIQFCYEIIQYTPILVIDNYVIKMKLCHKLFTVYSLIECAFIIRVLFKFAFD